MDAESILEKMALRFAKEDAVKDGISWRDNPTKLARIRRQEKYVSRYRNRFKRLRVKDLIEVLQLCDRALSQALVVKVEKPARGLCRQATSEVEKLLQELGARGHDTADRARAELPGDGERLGRSSKRRGRGRRRQRGRSGEEDQ